MNLQLFLESGIVVFFRLFHHFSLSVCLNDLLVCLRHFSLEDAHSIAQKGAVPLNLTADRFDLRVAEILRADLHDVVGKVR